ncbi:Fc.00g025070.m01.CDS01 [Cosmosporella sp. VM-42]
MSEKTDPAGVEAMDTGDKAIIGEEKTGVSINDGEIERGNFEDSPLPEVRVVVPPVDDLELPVSTFRAWFLGIISTVIVSAILQFFQLHSPPIFLAAYLVIIFTLPVGYFMARILPMKVFSLPFGKSFTLNPTV